MDGNVQTNQNDPQPPPELEPPQRFIDLETRLAELTDEVIKLRVVVGYLASKFGPSVTAHTADLLGK